MPMMTAFLFMPADFSLGPLETAGEPSFNDFAAFFIDVQPPNTNTAARIRMVCRPSASAIAFHVRIMGSTAAFRWNGRLIPVKSLTGNIP